MGRQRFNQKATRSSNKRHHAAQRRSFEATAPIEASSADAPTYTAEQLHAMLGAIINDACRSPVTTTQTSARTVRDMYGSDSDSSEPALSPMKERSLSTTSSDSQPTMESEAASDVENLRTSWEDLAVETSTAESPEVRPSVPALDLNALLARDAAQNFQQHYTDNSHGMSKEYELRPQRKVLSLESGLLTLDQQRSPRQTSQVQRSSAQNWRPTSESSSAAYTRNDSSRSNASHAKVRTHQVQSLAVKETPIQLVRRAVRVQTVNQLFMIAFLHDPQQQERSGRKLHRLEMEASKPVNYDSIFRDFQQKMLENKIPSHNGSIVQHRHNYFAFDNMNESRLTLIRDHIYSNSPEPLTRYAIMSFGEQKLSPRSWTLENTPYMFLDDEDESEQSMLFVNTTPKIGISGFWVSHYPGPLQAFAAAFDGSNKLHELRQMMVSHVSHAYRQLLEVSYSDRLATLQAEPGTAQWDAWLRRDNLIKELPGVAHEYYQYFKDSLFLSNQLPVPDTLEGVDAFVELQEFEKGLAGDMAQQALNECRDMRHVLINNDIYCEKLLEKVRQMLATLNSPTSSGSPPNQQSFREQMDACKRFLDRLRCNYDAAKMALELRTTFWRNFAR